MGLISLAADIADAQLEKGARGYIDPFIFPEQRRAEPARSSDPDEEAAQRWNMTPQKLRELRLFIQQTNKECEERLAREKVLVYKLNEQRTWMTPVGYITKGEAANVVRWVVPGELLDLDGLYGGMFIRADHLFISENLILDGLQRHGSNITAGNLVNRLIDERCSQRTAA
jgi:hypothetical protein